MIFIKKSKLIVQILVFIITFSAFSYITKENSNKNTNNSNNNSKDTIINTQADSYKRNEAFVIDNPESVGLDPKALQDFNTSYKDSSVQSLLIMKDSKLVFEQYYNNATKDSLNAIYSVTKSFISGLIGIALDNGYIDNTETKISKYFPEYFKESNDKNRDNITIRHLLTMTPGFVGNFSDFSSSLYSDVVKYTLDLPVNYKPGEKFQYANSASHLLSVIIQKTTGVNSNAFAKKHLFGELGIEEYNWASDIQGNNIGCSQLFLNSRDMLKFGMLYLQEGNWNGKQLISKSWIDESTTKKVDTTEETAGKDNVGYGYQWWVDSTKGYDYFTAAGYGGQFICVVKDLNLVVVVTSMPPELASNRKPPDIKEILENIILPALQ